MSDKKIIRFEISCYTFECIGTAGDIELLSTLKSDGIKDHEPKNFCILDPQKEMIKKLASELSAEEVKKAKGQEDYWWKAWQAKSKECETAQADLKKLKEVTP